MTQQAANPLPDRAWAKWSTGAVVAIWLFAIAAGWWCLGTYAYSVNMPIGISPVAQWPADATISRGPDQSTLLLFVHPKCPCTQATLTELDRLLVSLKDSSVGLPQLVVVATVPPSADDSWRETATLQRAKLLPNAQLFVDRDGREAARFGATTSGFVMLFDPSGARQFAGGVTASRGHEGPNVGCDRLTAILRGEATKLSETPAFGCRLCLPEQELHHVLAEPVGHGETTNRS